MRLLARLVNQVCKDCGTNNLSPTDIIGRKMFKQVVQASKKVGDTGPGKQVTNKRSPSMIGWQIMTQPIKSNIDYCLIQSCEWSLSLISNMIAYLYKNSFL